MTGASASPRLSVVVPVFNEEDGLEELQARLTEQLGALGESYEIVYVDDGSGDGSAALIEPWARAGQAVLVRLSRNFGMEIAMSAGLDQAKGDYVVLMHADLQDPPELIGEMLAAAEAGADVAYARRIGRDEGRVKRTLATGFYELMHRLAQVPYQGQAGDFRLMSRRVVEAVKAMPERRRFLRGMVAWVGYEQVPVDYRRAGRAKGRGASYPDLFRLAVEAFTSFSDVPLTLLALAGFSVAAACLVAAVVLLVLGAVGVVTVNVGLWTLIAVLVVGGVQLLGLGAFGRYLARVHAEALDRPLYLVDEVVSGPESAAAPAAASRPGAAAAPGGPPA